MKNIKKSNTKPLSKGLPPSKPGEVEAEENLNKDKDKRKHIRVWFSRIQDTMKRSNVIVMSIKEGNEFLSKSIENIFPNLDKEVFLQVQKLCRTPEKSNK